MTPDPVSFSDHLQRFHRSYASIHGYISLVVCLVGVVCNFFIVVVLTRRSMVNSTNLILTALAVSDVLTMASYIPFALQFYVLHSNYPSPRRNTRPWAGYILFHAHLSVTAHTVSIWLGVVLSIFRYSFVRLGGSKVDVTSEAGRQRATKMAIVCVYVTSAVVLLPNYLSLTIKETAMPTGGHVTLRDVTIHSISGDVIATTTRPVDDVTIINSATASSDVIVGGNASSVVWYYDVIGIESSGSGYGRLVTRLNFWIHALVIKLVPCFLMSVFGTMILCTVRTTHRASTRLRSRSTRSDTRMLRQREHNRTTSMLIVVIFLFLATELPQGMLALMSGVGGDDDFFRKYYAPLGDVMDIVALVNNGVNFALYCTMSTKFRKTFIQVLSRCCHLAVGGGVQARATAGVTRGDRQDHF